MSEQISSFEGKISGSYIGKEMLKLNIILLCIFAGITTIMSIIQYFEPDFNFAFLTLLILFIVIIPWVVLNILNLIYNSAYVRKFSYQVVENNIIINHGVFTQTRATIPYSRIQNINIVNGVFDRMFHTYTVKIETAGSSGAAAAAQSGGFIKPEGYIPGLKNPHLIEEKIKNMIKKLSTVPSGLEDKIFQPEELAFDNFISYILSKMREAENLEISIKELREKAGLSAVQLAEQVDVPIQTIKYLEKGQFNPSLALAYKIAEALKCKIEELFKMK